MEQNQGYGYADDNVEYSGPSFTFGLNAGVTFLKKFEWIPNGGANGAEQEALDIVFEINGKEKSYRKFPVTHGYKKGTNEQVTDPNSEEYKEALREFNAVMTHILHTFAEYDVIKRAFARPVNSFKEYCQIARSLVGSSGDPTKIPLDIFAQYQWQPRGNATQTYLDLPQNMKSGKWLCKSTPGVKWKEVKVENPDERTTEALYYIDESNPNNKHIFVRNGWFMLSNYARQQKVAGMENQDAIAASASAMNSGGFNQAPPQADGTAPAPVASGW